MSAVAPSFDRGHLESVRRKLQADGAGVPERLARAEACFRLAVLPEIEIEAAIELIREATDCDPYHPKLWFHLGRLLHKNGNPLGAVFEYRRELSLAPQSHRIYVHLVLALNDLAGKERKVGLTLLEALQTDDQIRLARSVADLDKLIEERLGVKR